jgi:hypothetical protein
VTPVTEAIESRDNLGFGISILEEVFLAKKRTLLIFESRQYIISDERVIKKPE